MPTIRDVAKLAGVSTATVSNVINNTREVSPGTRRSVLQAVEKLNYRPNPIARSLNTKSSYVVGMIVANIASPFYATMVRDIEDQLAVRNYNLIVCSTDEDQRREEVYLEMLLEKAIDGLIIAPTGSSQSLYEDYRRANIPLMFVDRKPSTQFGPTVSLDNVAAGYLATQHLIDLGHRQIGIVARQYPLSTVTGRINGFRKALQDHEVPVNEEFIKTVRFSVDDALHASLKLLAGPNRPTAVITANYIMTLGCLHALDQLGIRCPEDISLVCFDDSAWAPLFKPPLTVIDPKASDIATYAVSGLLEMMQRLRDKKEKGLKEYVEMVPDTFLQPSIVIRGSTRHS